VKLFIHIGLPKTAVTTLSYLFETCEKINFLGRPLKPIYGKIWQSMTFDNEQKFKKKIINYNQHILNSLSKDKVNILLIEGITDPFYSINNDINFIKRLKLLKDILKNKVNIRIIFVMRNHPDFILSRYIESPQSFEDYDRKWKNFECLKDSFKHSKIKKKTKKFFKYFSFYKICRSLRSSFGQKNINFLLYEQLEYEKQIFSKKLSKILSIKESYVNNILVKNKLNKSLKISENIFIKKYYQLNNIIIDNYIYKKFNKQIPRKFKNFFKNFVIGIDKFFYNFIIMFFSTHKITINEKEKYLIKKFFYKDNKKIEKNFKLNLKKYNYY
jgi:hypothetical protein